MSADAGIAILFLIVFLFGIALGIIVIVSWASNREDKRKSLKGPAPSIGCGGARRLVGVGRRDITPGISPERLAHQPRRDWGQDWRAGYAEPDDRDEDDRPWWSQAG